MNDESTQYETICKGEFGELHAKLDRMDEAIRGNGKPGIQLRLDRLEQDARDAGDGAMDSATSCGFTPSRWAESTGMNLHPPVDNDRGCQANEFEADCHEHKWTVGLMSQEPGCKRQPTEREDQMDCPCGKLGVAEPQGPLPGHREAVGGQRQREHEDEVNRMQEHIPQGSLRTKVVKADGVEEPSQANRIQQGHTRQDGSGSIGHWPFRVAAFHERTCT